MIEKKLSHKIFSVAMSIILVIGLSPASALANTVPASEGVNDIAAQQPQDDEGALGALEDPAVAKIGDTEYYTLQAAFDAAAANDTVTLLSDVDATGAMYSGV